jgi:flagellar basal-body rod protein FlgB
MGEIFQSDYLRKALDAASLRKDIIASNIANANTVGYTSKAVAFEDELKNYLAAKDQSGFRQCSIDGEEGFQDAGEGNLDDVSPSVYDEGAKPDVNQQMANLAKAQIVYASLTQTYKKINYDYVKMALEGIQR